MLEGDVLTFWNIDRGWIDDYFTATPFNGEILTLPLPIGATGVMPFTHSNEPKGFFPIEEESIQN